MQIVIDQVSKRYRSGTQALSNVSLTIESGMFGLLGPNGAGKTTLMRILATLMQPSAGRVQIAGMDPADQRQKWQIKALLGYLPQEVAFYGSLSAREFLDLVATLKGLPKATERRRQIEHVLEVTGLTDVAKRRIKTFSGGMKRRVGIAQALLGDPQVLIVDEPTAGLDPQERMRFRNLLVSLAPQRVVLLSSHIIEDIAQTCATIGVLNHGQLTFHGATSTLIERTQGCVWEFSAPAFTPPPDTTLVATTPASPGLLYRVLAAEPPHPDAVPVAPRLEDGYLWHMRAPQPELMRARP